MKTILISTALLGALAIILGAFGAHVLKSMLTPNQLQSFETGVHYQMYHVLAIYIVASFTQISIVSKKIVSILFLSGILFFSGSIYAITVGTDPKLIWFITPLGGLLFITGWLLLAMFLYKSQKYSGRNTI